MVFTPDLSSRHATMVPTPSASPRAIVTFLTPAERERVDAAGYGCYTTLHRENLDDLLVDLRTQPVSAVVVSVARYQQQHAPQMARLVREFPRVPAVALLAANETRTTHALLALGQHGIRSLVDVREPSGWRDLRQFVTREDENGIEPIAIQRIRQDLAAGSPDTHRFFEALFTAPRSLTTVRDLSRLLGVLPTTFMSRFFRAKLPAPKQYLAAARLVRAARLFENPGYSITHVAFLLEYSSPQSFSRHVHHVMRMGAADFRQQFTGHGMLDRMRHDLVLPYLEVWPSFEALTVTPQWIVRRVK